VISRYRADCSWDVATRLFLGPALLEAIGFATDRRMLLGVKERAEALDGTDTPCSPTRVFQRRAIVGQRVARVFA
jgi:hypothetical protein